MTRRPARHRYNDAHHAFVARAASFVLMCVLVEVFGQALPGVERLHGQCGDPRREVRVDRPAAVIAHRPAEEIERPLHDGMRRVSRRDEAHGDEAGQRGGFQKSAVGRLERVEHTERAGRGRVANQSRDGISRRSMTMPDEAHGDQGRQCVTHDRQRDDGEKFPRDHRKLKGQLRNETPGLRARSHSSCERTHCEDRHGKRPVLAVPRLNGFRERGRSNSASRVRQPRFGAAFGSRDEFASRGERQRRPSECRCADVAEAAIGVTPAAVLVLVIEQPSGPTLDPIAIPKGVARRFAQGERECHDGCSRRQRAAGKPSFPMAGGGLFLYQRLARGEQGGVSRGRLVKVHGSHTAK